MIWKPDWDLGSIPADVFYTEVARRRGATSRRREPVLKPCPKCETPSNATQRRKKCTCGYVWPVKDR